MCCTMMLCLFGSVATSVKFEFLKYLYSKVTSWHLAGPRYVVHCWPNISFQMDPMLFFVYYLLPKCYITSKYTGILIVWQRIHTLVVTDRFFCIFSIYCFIALLHLLDEVFYFKFRMVVAKILSFFKTSVICHFLKLSMAFTRNLVLVI